MNRSWVSALFLSFLVIAGLACSQATTEPQALAQVKESEQSLPKVPVGPPTKEDKEKLVQGNNEFAFDLYRQLSQAKGNVVFSPYSISTALAMSYGGARGQTAAAMAQTLHFTLPQERLHPACGNLIEDLQKEYKGRPYDLHIANALWGQKNYGFEKDFLQLTQKNYRAGLKEVNFGNAEQARQTINRWVEEQTKDRIKELLKPGIVDSTTCLVLTNAVYFKARWQMPFHKEDTKDADFEVTPADKVRVAMMTRDEKFNYFEGDEFQCVELPYQGERLAMVLFLPRKQNGLASLEKGPTTATLQDTLRKLKPRLGNVSLPRFQLDTYYALAGDLQEMGMPLGGDFSGIAPGLHIAFVEHKAFINVDEVGTEAAAATAIGMGRSGSIRFSFRADHPFLFLIRDRQTGSILFMGRVSDPRS